MDLYKVNFMEYVRSEISNLLCVNYPVKFFWDRYGKQNPYVVYQTEDLEQPTKLDITYANFLNGAVEVFEYSEPNQERYSKSTVRHWLPNENSEEYNCDKTCEVLFYGSLTDVRKNVISGLGNVTVTGGTVSDFMMGNLRDSIRSAEWVLSVGAHNNIHNDLLRVTPILNFGGRVMTERTQEEWYNEYLMDTFPDRVKFI